MGQRPKINSVGQRPTKQSPCEKALKGRKRSIGFQPVRRSAKREHPETHSLKGYAPLHTLKGRYQMRKCEVRLRKILSAFRF